MDQDAPWPDVRVPYNNRARKQALKYGVCPLCGKTGRLVLDHCYPHDWVRGPICYSCNVKMGYVDRGYNTSRFYPAVYKQWRHRCGECRARARRAAAPTRASPAGAASTSARRAPGGRG